MSVTMQWVNFTETLGLSFTTVNKQRAHCPLCRQGRLTFYSDLASGGKRFSTSCCLRSGDLLSLIRLVRKVDVRSAEHFLEVHYPEGYADWLNSKPQREACNSTIKQLESAWSAAIPLSNACNSTWFTSFIQTLGLEFSHLQAWHREGIDRQFRYITRQALVSTLKEAGLNISDQLPSRNDTAAFLVSPGYYVPGHLASLTFFYINNRDRSLSYVQLLTDPDSQNPGYLIHPVTAAKQLPVVFLEDHKWFLKASFWQANHASVPCSFATNFDRVGARTLTSQVLQHRDLTLWCPKLNPRMLRAAERLSCLITHYGVSTGEFHRGCFMTMNPSDPFKTLRRHSMTWQSSIARCADRTPRQDLSEVIIGADLPDSALKDVAGYLDESGKAAIADSEHNRLQPSQVSGSFGVVEQTPGGWYVTHRGQTEQVCSMSWRISASYDDQESPQYELEFYYGGSWVRSLVSKRDLMRKTIPTLVEACIDKGLPPFTVSSKWRSQLLHLAMQLNPLPAQSMCDEKLGVDSSNYVIRFTRCEISSSTGDVKRVASRLRKRLLPQADGSMPCDSAIRDVVLHKPTCSVVSAIVLQLLRQSFGSREAAVGYGGQYAALISSVLSGLELDDSRSHSLLDIVNDGHMLTTKQVQYKLTGEDSAWAAAPKRGIYWLAGTRPAYYLGDYCQPTVPCNPVHLQRLVVQLLSLSIKLVNDNRTHYRAVREAWTELLRLSGYGGRRQPSVPKTIRTIDAFAYWIDVAVRSGMYELRRGRPQRPSSSFIYGADDEVTLYRKIVNTTIQKHGYAPWEMSQLLSSFISCDEFVANRRVGGLEMTTIKTSLLSQDVQGMLAKAVRNRSTTKEGRKKSAG